MTSPQLTGTDGFAIPGKSTEDNLGSAITGAGDVNGDGYRDIVIGAKECCIDFGSMPGPGKVYVIFGGPQPFPTPFDLDTLDGSNGFVIHGQYDNDRLGTSVASGFDWNDDGVDDVIIGAIGVNQGVGRVYVVFGRTDTTPPLVIANINGTQGTGGWYVSDVHVSWSIADPESGIQASSGCQSTWVGQDTSGRLFECTVTSAGGTTTKRVVIRRDATPPQVTIATPADEASYALHQHVVAQWQVVDDHIHLDRGVGSVAATVPNGTPIDTSQSGQQRFTVEATDAAGNVTGVVHYYEVGAGNRR